ncbi:MAG TPA: hypothetical protein VFJ58_04395 [Armatimonadota bacterium]|nr:hypothetical protein [Armatimonadota bacterium]
MVNNADFVNTLQRIEKRIQGSGFTFDSDLRDYFLIRGETSVKARLKLVRLHSPSSTDVLNKASPDALLVISGASQKAAKAAAGVNHILVPDGGFRIVAPGVALIHGADVRDETSTPRQVKFAGRTGVVAETLLLAGRVNWSVHRLAAASNVSPGLVVRVVLSMPIENSPFCRLKIPHPFDCIGKIHSFLYVAGFSSQLSLAPPPCGSAAGRDRPALQAPWTLA